MKRFLVLLACAAALPAHGTTPPASKPQQLTSPGQVPEGLAKSDWSSIRAAYEAGRHQFFKQDDGSHIARNPGLGWKMEFDERGFTAKPKDGSWEWGLELEVGRVVPNPPSLSHNTKQDSKRLNSVGVSNRLETPRTPAITEWFINDPRGLEQGWTLTAPAELRLRVRGNLKPSVSPQSVSFGGQLTYSGLKAWDATGKIIPSHFETTAEGFAVRYDDTAAQYPLTIDPIAQSDYVKASNSDSEDQFGRSVAISGDTLVIGAPYEDGSATGVNGTQDNGANDSGAAYVFSRIGNVWHQQAYLKASQVTRSDYFGWSVAISGDTVVVGAPIESGSSTGVNGTENELSYAAGAAYIFVRSGTTWSQQAYLKAAQVSQNDQFGYGVAISGETVVVGAILEDGSASGVNGIVDEGANGDGAAYVFVRSGTNWSQQAYLKASQDLFYRGLFGSAVAISGDTVVVGEVNQSSGVANSGAAHIFIRSGATWSYQAYLKLNQNDYEGNFGFSVAVSGDTVVIGKRGDSSSSTGVNGTVNQYAAGGSGAAYVFVRNGTAWSQQAYLKASQVTAQDYLGYSVAISDDKVVVGAPWEDGNAAGVNGVVNELANSAGAALVFTRSGTTWSQQAYLKASQVSQDDSFGLSVAVSGDTVIVGAIGEDGGTTGLNGTQNEVSRNSGAAYIFTDSLVPVVSTISPISGSTVGNTNVTITGVDFIGTTGVSIGGLPASNVRIVNARTIVCNTPAHIAGTASVLVTTSLGTNEANALFTYVAPNVSPSFTLPEDAGTSAGAIWTAQESIFEVSDGWSSIASSVDGIKLAATDQGGNIHTSTNFGLSWNVRAISGNWWSIASSSDGTKLAAVDFGDRIYTSMDSGVNWTARDSIRKWSSIATSADGTKLVALVYNGQIYTSTDSGVNWTARESNRTWRSVASSADGTKLAAGCHNGQIYTSTDSGVSWTAQTSDNKHWLSIASSSDGTKLAAVDNEDYTSRSGRIYTSTDSGVSWQVRNINLWKKWVSVASSADGTKLAAVSYDGQISTSTDSGMIWKDQVSDSKDWRSITSSADGTKLAAVAGNSSQIYTSIGAPYAITVKANSGPVSLINFVTNISAGPPSESAQTVSFTVTNDNAALFSSQPEIDACGMLTFTPQVTSKGIATVTVIANDSGGTAYAGVDSSAPQTFTITTTAPEIAVSGNSMDIANEDTTPSLADHTDFGPVPLFNQQVTRRFTIANVGSQPLNLTGILSVQITGAASGDFKVTALPTSPVANGGSTSFEITFDPRLLGMHTAAINIASDDLANPTYTFAIAGFGGLNNSLSQSITFTSPTTLYLSQSPLALSAYSSSALPVAFRVVSGPASLSGSNLTLTSVGTVKVEAKQAGGGHYLAAPPVLKTITVKADPTVLTLLKLAQIYDGTPKPISTLGGGAATITYKVGSTTGPTAPTAAGSYAVAAVAGGVTKTGTLVIAKAPLYVTPDDQRKFAGKVNPVLTYSITGYRGTDTATVVTKAPILKTTATTASPGGLYPITASSATALNYSLIYQQGTMIVESFAGSYEALLVDGDGKPVGKLSLTVTAPSTAFTAKLSSSTETSALSFSGPLNTDPSLEQATGSAMVTKSTVPYAINFTLPLNGKNFLSSATRDSSALGSATNGQKLSSAPALYAGAHTVVLEPATPGAANVPVGAGWATAAISTTGMLTLTGKLGDGTAFTSTASPDGMSNPGYRVFVQPYLAARTQSFLAGSFNLIPHPALTNRRRVAAADMTWKKSGLPTDSSYRIGFGTVNTVLMLDPWQKPVAAIKTLPGVTLPERLGLVTPNFAVVHSASGSAANANLPTRLALSSTNAVSVHTPQANLTKWKTATFNTTNGTFTGSFELVDGVLKRPVTFSGVLRQPADSMDALIGDGHYLLPPMSGTEKSSGEVNFQRP